MSIKYWQTDKKVVLCIEKRKKIVYNKDYIKLKLAMQYNKEEKNYAKDSAPPVLSAAVRRDGRGYAHGGDGHRKHDRGRCA